MIDPDAGKDAEPDGAERGGAGIGRDGEPAELGQQLLAGMPVPLYPCTPTRLNTWLGCPRRYRFAYLDRPTPPKGPPWAHNSIGAAVHSALADWWVLSLAERTPEAGQRLVRRRWLTEGFRDADQSARAGRRALDWVSEYLAGVDPADEPVGVERTVSATTRSLVLSGRVDRIDGRPRRVAGQAEPVAGDGLVIVDYKTGRHVPDAVEARSSLALAAYAVGAARVLRRPCHRVELHHLPSGTQAVAQYTAAELAGQVAHAEIIAQDCAQADQAYRSGRRGDAPFEPRPSAGCSWCDFRRNCPAGQAAAPDRAPWSALPD